MLQVVQNTILKSLCIFLMLFASQNASGKIVDRPWENASGEFFEINLSEAEETNPNALKTHREIMWVEVRIVSGVAYYAYCHNDPINKVDILGLKETATGGYDNAGWEAMRDESLPWYARTAAFIPALTNSFVPFTGDTIYSHIGRGIHKGAAESKQDMKVRAAKGELDPYSHFVGRAAMFVFIDVNPTVAPFHIATMDENTPKEIVNSLSFKNSVDAYGRYWNNPTMGNFADTAEATAGPLMFWRGVTVRTPPTVVPTSPSNPVVGKGALTNEAYAQLLVRQKTPYAHQYAGWQNHIDAVISDMVQNGRPKIMILGEGGQGKIRSFVNRDPRMTTEFLEMRPKSIDYTNQFKAGAGTAAMEAETLAFNLELIRHLHKQGFTFEVIGKVNKSSSAKSAWLKAELEVLESLGVKWKRISESEVGKVKKLPAWNRSKN